MSEFSSPSCAEALAAVTWPPVLRTQVPLRAAPAPRSVAVARWPVALLATPSGCGSSSITNPFDVEPEQLTQPSCSPSMFLTRSRQTPGSGHLAQQTTIWASLSSS
ncbi:hypothetical protein HPB52_010310 [Rhipicephalus sanguineus]|uniref:Uncharacterized protein n=1 Tax=Rhipicephalus sanguineus TaxID=34632 RepID=A0A9D4PDF5_RHISA|nr:hypothetical protein HPB52_010310 [Rhipicephalus sanguineus]